MILKIPFNFNQDEVEITWKWKLPQIRIAALNHVSKWFQQEFLFGLRENTGF
jgi:hypothetical protein